MHAVVNDLFIFLVLCCWRIKYLKLVPCSGFCPLLSATQKRTRKSHPERRKSGSPFSHKPSQSMPCAPIFRTVRGKPPRMASFELCLCLLSRLIWLIQKSFTTSACMSRCVANALTYLGTPRWPNELTLANPLPAMAYTRCWVAFILYSMSSLIKLFYLMNQMKN